MCTQHTRAGAGFHHRECSRSLSILGRILDYLFGWSRKRIAPFSARMRFWRATTQGMKAEQPDLPKIRFESRALCVCPDTVLTELSHPSTLTVRMSVREEVVCR